MNYFGDNINQLLLVRVRQIPLLQPIDWLSGPFNTKPMSAWEVVLFCQKKKIEPIGMNHISG